jgi:hypothetical protein
MKGFKYVLLLMILSACNSGVKNTAVDTLSRNAVVDTVSKSPMADIGFFDKPVTVIITPSERLITKMKSKMEGGEYNTVVDDNGFYLSQSIQYLDSVKAYKVERESEGSIKFKTLSGNTYEMKLDTVFFGVMLFNGKDKPVMADITALKEDYVKYMKK